jgi:hypothetical protein
VNWSPVRLLKFIFDSYEWDKRTRREAVGAPEPRAAAEYEVSSLALELFYSVRDGIRRDERGTGQVVDVGSSGARFVADRNLAVGRSVEIAIDWPMRLDGSIPLRLIATGVVIRTCGTETAMKFDRHVFKTRRTHDELAVAQQSASQRR